MFPLSSPYLNAIFLRPRHYGTPIFLGESHTLPIPNFLKVFVNEMQIKPAIFRRRAAVAYSAFVPRTN